ncbi:MAG: cryptochrome/photolyase family protein [Pseudomonadota bacterium]
MACRNLILVFGDQLSDTLSSLGAGDPARDHVLMAEVREETDYANHHQKKIAFLFSAMRLFARRLREAGWSVTYVKLDETGYTGSFSGEVERAVSALCPDRILVTEPGEWRVLQTLRAWPARLGLPVTILDDTRFVCSRQEFAAWAEGRKQLRMEFFYREMRRKTALLMDGDHPVGGKWNYDAENRKPAKADLFMPKPARFDPCEVTAEVLELVDREFAHHFGDLEPFWFAVSHDQADEALECFLSDALPFFGDYQDAMLSDERFLYHSVLSAYINAGLLDPLDVCRRVEAEFHAGRAPLNAAEGFIRQIIGWREFVRGIYWMRMPGYVDENFFGARRPLPWFYWSGDTDMACLKAAITQTKQEAYAHHIQRLMVTGNFALLAGIDPAQVHEWYLAVYADAYEWVELPNTLGMSQFADGGVLGSKPYAASGNYINKMSDYCADCAYSVKQKTGAGACPFNALYWHFLHRNADKLRGNPRLGQIYRVWDRMDGDKRAETLRSAEQFLQTLDDNDGRRALAS